MQEPNTARDAQTESRPSPARTTPRRWEPPRYEVISLDCEITAYAPDDEPLF